MSTSWPSSSTLAVAKRSCSTGSAPSAGGERGRVALDDEVEVGPAAAEQQVADGAADQVDGLGRRGRDRGQLRIGRAAAPRQIRRLIQARIGPLP